MCLQNVQPESNPTNNRIVSNDRFNDKVNLFLECHHSDARKGSYQEKKIESADCIVWTILA